MDSAAFEAASSALARHRLDNGGVDLRAAFAADPQRFDRFSASLDDLLLDYSKCAVTDRTLELLLELARAAGVEARRDAMLAGERINSTENRAVLHTALRNRSGTPVLVDGQILLRTFDRLYCIQNQASARVQ